MDPDEFLQSPWLWFSGVTANLLAAALFASLGYLVIRNLHRSSQLGDNHLGRATGYIFVAAAVSHLLHAGIYALQGANLVVMVAAVAVDNVAVATLLVYLATRRRHGRTNAMYDDLQELRRALEINDAVVQRLTEAKLALDLGQVDLAYEAVGSSLEQSKRICNDMMSHAPGPLRITGRSR